MPAQAFLKLDGIEGQSKHAEHRNWIDLLGWNSRPLDSRGRKELELGLHKAMDKASPGLLKSFTDGRTIETGTLVVREKGGRITLEMKSVVVAAYNPPHAERGDVVLNTQSFHVTDLRPPEQGGGRGAWDLWNVRTRGRG